MKCVTATKSIKSETPKTPGGISKSLLTPCRRVGLSRNWKKAGPSPFISPLSGVASSTVEVKIEKKETRKRKERVETEENEEGVQCTPETPTEREGILDVDVTNIREQCAEKDEDLTSTPTRHVEVPRKKKSKTLLSALSSNTVLDKDPPCPINTASNILLDTKEDNFGKNIENESEIVVTPVQKSRSKIRKTISPQNTAKENVNNESDTLKDTKTDEIVVTPVQKSKSQGKNTKTSPKTVSKTEINVQKNEDYTQKQQKVMKGKEIEAKPKSPNELTKECIVVIQKKIFKTDKKGKDKIKLEKQFDSDSDDVPLRILCKDKIDTLESRPEAPKSSEVKDIINLDDEDFIETKKPKIKKLEDKATSIGGLKKKLSTKAATIQTQNEFDDEDDFDFDNKKTILIRKTYEKVPKPQKAKSTGSITQKDIDELKARIETKKKMLLARAMTEDTLELRTLIKKWQKGCQDALIELMELMKTKYSDKPNMDYSEMLSMLKIPANLVGYDEENDCFTTPEDANIILSKFND